MNYDHCSVIKLYIKLFNSIMSLKHTCTFFLKTISLPPTRQKCLSDLLDKWKCVTSHQDTNMKGFVAAIVVLLFVCWNVFELPGENLRFGHALTRGCLASLNCSLAHVGRRSCVPEHSEVICLNILHPIHPWRPSFLWPEFGLLFTEPGGKEN